MSAAEDTLIRSDVEQGLVDRLSSSTTAEIDDSVAVVLASSHGMNMGSHDSHFIIGWLRACGFLVPGVDADGSDQWEVRGAQMVELTVREIDRRATVAVAGELDFEESLAASVVGWLRACRVLIVGCGR